MANKSKQQKLREKLQELELDDVDRWVVYYKCTEPTWSLSAIAKEIGVSKATVFRRAQRPAVLDAIAEATQDLSTLLSKAKIKAARRIGRLVDSVDEGIALQATKTLLAAELQPGQVDGDGRFPVKFVTIVNEMGVLESSAAEATTIDIEASPRDQDQDQDSDQDTGGPLIDK